MLALVVACLLRAAAVQSQPAFYVEPDGSLDAEAYVWGPFGYTVALQAAKKADITTEELTVLLGPTGFAGGDVVTVSQSTLVVSLARTYLKKMIAAGSSDADVAVDVLLPVWIWQQAPLVPDYIWRPEGWAAFVDLSGTEAAATLFYGGDHEAGTLITAEAIVALRAAYPALVSGGKTAEGLSDRGVLAWYAGVAVLAEGRRTVYSVAFKAAVSGLTASVDSLATADELAALVAAMARYLGVADGAVSVSVVARLAVAPPPPGRRLQPADVDVSFTVAAPSASAAAAYSTTLEAMTVAMFSSALRSDVDAAGESRLLAVSVETVAPPAVVEASPSDATFDDDTYVPEEYSPSNYVKLMSGFYHAGDKEFSTDKSYQMSVVGFAAFVAAIGVVMLVAFLFYTCFARCRCYRRKNQCCFRAADASASSRRGRRAAVAIVLLAAGATLVGGYGPRESIDSACTKVGDSLSDLADLLTSAEAGLTSIDDVQLPRFTAVAPTLGCPNEYLKIYVERFVVEAMPLVGDTLDLVDGLPADLRDTSEKTSEDGPKFIDYGLAGAAALIWFLILFAIIALCTQCRCDDTFVQALFVLVLLIIVAFVAVCTALTVSVSDFCQADAGIVVQLAEENNFGGENLRVIRFITTCDVANPIRNGTLELWDKLYDLEAAARGSAAACNAEAIDELVGAIDDTKAGLFAADAATGCAKLNPIYYDAIYDATCGDVVDGISGLVFVISASLILLWLGIICIPCVNYDDGDKDHGKRLTQIDVEPLCY